MGQWNSIASPLFRDMAENGESPQFSITLPTEAVEIIEQGLIPFGLYGKKRAAICRELILRMLTTTEVRANAQEGREKASKPKA